MDITKDTLVTIGDKKVSVETLAKMFPALGFAPTVSPPVAEKPIRGIVKPTAARDLTKAAQALKPSTPAQPTVVAASSPKTYPEVMITITKELVSLKNEAPVEMYVLSKRCPSPGGKGKPRKGELMSHYNYRFDKGFTYHHTLGAGKPGWKWDDKREVKYIPLDAFETLLQGLRETYAGATLVIGDQIVTL